MNSKTRQNHQENEVRALLSPSLLEQLPDKLLRAGAIFKGKEVIKDLYFCSQTANSFDTIAMYKTGSYSLRLRAIKTATGSDTQLNAKVITRDGDYGSWEEHETRVESFDETVHILKAVGFKVFFSLEKIRQNFTYENYSIALEEIEDFGPIIEVEVMTPFSEPENIIKDLFNFISTLGVERDQILNRSVTKHYHGKEEYVLAPSLRFIQARAYSLCVKEVTNEFEPYYY